LIDKLWTPDNPLNIENTTWTAIVECQAIFEALIKNGEEHFSQASHTPFASGPVADVLAPFEFNEVSQQILRGEFDIDSITKDIQLCSIIKAMSHSDPTNPIEADSELTIEKLKQGFSYIKESTSSNPEGLHHGIWKTLIKDEDAFKPYALMIMFAFKYGEPPNVWTNSHQIILGKDNPGKPIKINSTKIQLPTGCNMFHREGVQQYPGKVYANGTLQNGNQQIDTNRSMIWTGTLCLHVRFRTMATPRFHQEQAPHSSSTKE
jgi:hypothetical protein